MDFRGNRQRLPQCDLGNNRKVMNWLASVINTLDSDVANRNRPLHNVLGQLSTDLQTMRRTQLDGDGDEDNDIVESMITHLQEILALE